MLLKLRLTVLALFILCATHMYAQVGYPIVSFEYADTELQNVLIDLEDRYDLHFSYSPSRLPLSYGITARVHDQDFGDAVKELFQGTPIKHAFIGNQVVLRADQGQLSMLQTTKAKPRQTTPLYQEKPPPPKPRDVKPASPRISSREPQEVSGGERWLNGELDEESLAKMAAAMQRHERELAMEEYDETHRLAQISLLPYLGTNQQRSDEVTNNVSVNVLWGTSKAVDGFEVGGLGNTVMEDVRGVQLAGMFNQVGGKVTGTQIAGLFNQAEKGVLGAQVAGLGNISRDSIIGTQIGGLFNTNGYHIDGMQISGLFNVADGDVGHQISGLFNRAHTVHKRQVGLINICDSTAKAGYGLINIVQQGYNRIEVGASEGMFVTAGAKFGSRKLYNIILFGLRWDELEQTTPTNETAVGSFTSWSLGYGLGAAIKLRDKGLWNFELIASHVNEYETWTNELNLLVQFRTTMDWKIGRRFSLYAGPSVNFFISERPLIGVDEFATHLPYEPFGEYTDGDTRVHAWLGFTAGIRL